MRLAGTKLAANHQYRGFGDQLYDLSGQRPSLDLNFSSTKSLVDSTTGQNLVTFTRASSGTYVDSQGVIQRATTNLKTFSENFSDASYSVSTRLTVTSDALAAPNGTITADKLVATSNNDQKFVETTASVTSGLAYVFGMFAKKAEYEVLQISVANTNFSGTLAYANFNLDSGSIVSSVDCTPVIQTIGDGWYRCSVIMAAATSTGTNAFRFSPYSSGNPGRLASYTGDGTSGIFIWGAQLEQSSTVGEYIPTTSTINSAPRFDHNPTTGESLGLLVEEQRTNLLLRSEEFDNASWSPTGLASVAANSTAAPDGTTTADIFVETSGVSETHRALQTVSVTSGVSYAASVFAKQDQRRYCYLIFSPNATWNSVNTIAYFDLQTGVVVSAANCTATITAFPNGWYRCTATATATATNAAASVGVGVSTNGTAQTYTGNGSNAIAVWGAQLEVGAFPTSYIPTTTAAVTRSADVASITGSNFSSWYRQDEGTVFASATTNARHGGTNSFPRIHTISDGTNDNAIGNYFRVLATYTDAGYGVNTLTVSQATFDTNNERNGQSVSTVYANNDFAFAVGGSVVNTDNTGTVPAVSQLRLGARGTGLGPLNGTIRRLTYFPVRLANETLQRITQ